jgi:hypothetical protein
MHVAVFREGWQVDEIGHPLNSDQRAVRKKPLADIPG